MSGAQPELQRRAALGEVLGVLALVADLVELGAALHAAEDG